MVSVAHPPQAPTEQNKAAFKPFSQAFHVLADLTLGHRSGRETGLRTGLCRSKKDVIFHHLSRQRILEDGIAATLRQAFRGAAKKDSGVPGRRDMKKILSSPTNCSGLPHRQPQPRKGESRKPAERGVAARRERLVRSFHRRADSNDRRGISRDDQRFGSRPWRLEDVTLCLS